MRKLPHGKTLTHSRVFQRLRLAGIFSMVCGIKVLADWQKNYFHVFAQDLIPTLVFCVVMGLVLGAVFSPLYRRNALVGIVVGSIVTFMLNQAYAPLSDAFFARLQRFGLNEPTADLLYIALVVLLALALGFWIVKQIQRRTWNTDVFSNAVTVTVSAAFLLQVLPVAWILISTWSQFTYRPAVLSIAADASKTERPDIYYIILDRYTNDAVLKNQFNFDNSDFTNFLTNNGYVVKPDAFSNYPYTASSISSTLIGDYQSELVKKFASSPIQINQPYQYEAQNSPVIEYLKSLGYTYYLLGSWYETTNSSPLADDYFEPIDQFSLFGKEHLLNSFVSTELKESVLWQFVKNGVSFGSHPIVSFADLNTGRSTLYKLGRLKEIIDQPAGGKLVLAHFLVPHDPYYLNADGSWSEYPESNNVGEPIKQKYLGQVEYMNAQMKDVLSRINQSSSGKAIVILQSDEGPYPIQLNHEEFDPTVVANVLNTSDMSQWSVQDLQEKFGILAAYHLPGVSEQDVQSTNSASIFRLVANAYFGATQPYLPDCHYALTEGKKMSFIFKDISEQLTGQKNAACSEDSSQ